MKATCGPGEYAHRLGVTLDTVRKAAVRIPLPWQPGNITVDIEANDRAWYEGYKKGLVQTPGPWAYKRKSDDQGDEEKESDDDRETSKLEDAKLRKELAQARNWELRNEALERKLILVTEVEATWLGFVGAIDAAFNALPEKLAARIDGDKREIKRVAREVIAELRDELSDQVERIAVEVEESSGPVAAVLERMDGASTAPPIAAPAAPAPKKRGRPPKVRP